MKPKKNEISVPDDFIIGPSTNSDESSKAFSAFLRANSLSIYRKKKRNLNSKSKKKIA